MIDGRPALIPPRHRKRTSRWSTRRPLQPLNRNKLPIETICSEYPATIPFAFEKARQAAMAAQYIRVVAIPPGEAPLWVREKWVGLRLPVADGRGPRDAYVSGVLSGPRTRFLAFVRRVFGNLSKQTGYPVYVRDAISELEKVAPDAAAWWRTDASRLLASDRKLLFRAAYCELVKPPRGADNQSARPFQREIASPAAAGLSPASRIRMPHKVARISLARSPFVPGLMLVLFLLAGYLNWSHSVQPERQATVHGTLVDWNVYNVSSKGGSHRKVQLQMAGYPEEFRIDMDRMGNRLPAGFAKGAAIDITADAAQLASPLHPLFEPGVAIVWVNGLVVDGVTAFAVGDVVDHQRKQWIPWFMMVGMAAAYLAYTIMNSRKQHAST